MLARRARSERHVDLDYGIRNRGSCGISEMGAVRSVSDFASGLKRVVEDFSADAFDVDRADSIPINHFEQLADLGLYGAFAPTSDGGLELGLPELCAIVEELAAACLASTFVWIQHFRLLAAVLDPAGPPILRDQYLKVIRGEVRGGWHSVAFNPARPDCTRRQPLTGGYLRASHRG
jgi:hypothetical protein